MMQLFRRRTSDERGAVMVFFALTLPVLTLFVAFGVEIGHWYDYSRNLQNRADAAALAAGDAYGAICFGSPTAAQTDVIGQVAQQYAGPPTQDPKNLYTVPNNLPYPYTTFTPAQYKNVPNLTKGAPSNYHMLLNSTAYWDKGGTDWSMESKAEKAGDPSPPSSLAICGSTDEDGNSGPMVDVRLTQANLGLLFPFLGVSPTISAHARVALQGVGAENNIIPIAVRDPASERCVEANFYNDSTGNQIASVPLKKIGTDPNTGDVQWDNAAAPVSVSIPSGANVYEQIETGYCDANAATYDSGSGLLYVNSWSTSAPTAGQAPAVTRGGVTLTGPCPADKLSNQYFTDETCKVGVTAHVSFDPTIPYPAETVTAKDTSGNGGGALTLSKLNTSVSGPNTQTVAAGGLLQVASTAGFAPAGSIDDNGPANGSGTVKSFAYSAIADATHFKLTNGGTFNKGDVITQTGDTAWTSSAASGFTIQPTSGQHQIDISTTQSVGTPCTVNKKASGNCDLGVEAQAFGACNSGNPTLTCSNPPNDSGPIVLSQLRLASDSSGTWASDAAQTYGENAFAGGGTQQLIATVEIAGLSNAKPGDAPTILRFTENAQNANHATGLIDCGQGPSKPGSIATIINGCPVDGSPACGNGGYDTRCAPLAINSRPLSDNAPCNPEGNDLSGTIVPRTPATPMVPVDCTGTVAGNMPPVITGVACRILTFGCDDKGNPNGTQCASNNWSPTEGAASIPAGDPRAVTMVITAPSDLAKNNSGQIIPIENFAVFYITGWTTQGSAPACGSYAPTPPGASMDAENANNCPDGTVPKSGNCNPNPAKGMVWGFWIKYTNPGSISSGQPCALGTFGDCTPVLTR